MNIPEPVQAVQRIVGGFCGRCLKATRAINVRAKRRVSVAGLAAVVFAFSAPTAVATFIRDDFNAPDGTDLVGRDPFGVGGPYVPVGSVGLGDATIQSGKAHIRSGAGIASYLGTDKWPWFWTNVRVALGDSQFIGMGFYAQPADNVLENFSGWVLHRSGLLQMYVDGSLDRSEVASVDPDVELFFGTWDYIDLREPPGFGSEVRIHVGDPSWVFSTDGFTQQNTAYAGLFVGSGPVDSYGDFDAYDVWWIPEPAPLAPLAAGFLAYLLGVRRRR